MVLWGSELISAFPKSLKIPLFVRSHCRTALHISTFFPIRTMVWGVCTVDINIRHMLNKYEDTMVSDSFECCFAGMMEGSREKLCTAGTELFKSRVGKIVRGDKRTGSYIYTYLAKDGGCRAGNNSRCFCICRRDLSRKIVKDSANHCSSSFDTVLPHQTFSSSDSSFCIYLRKVRFVNVQ